MPKYNNKTLDAMNTVLDGYLDKTGKLGYAIARNKRLISDNLTEFSAARRGLVEKYGVTTYDDDGNPLTITVAEGDPNYPKFVEEITPILEAEITVDIFTISSAEAIEQLNAKGFLELEWMIDFDEEGEDATT